MTLFCYKSLTNDTLLKRVERLGHFQLELEVR